MDGVAQRSEVKSGDGGSIAVWVEGDGPPLVLTVLNCYVRWRRPSPGSD